MNEQKMISLVHNLYQAVDNKDLDYLSKILAKQARFRIGNNSALTDKVLILEGNRQFFASVKSMSHSIDDIVYQGSDEHGISKVCCYGSVKYLRLDGSEHAVVFSTFLAVQNSLIIDYLVFVDLSGL